MCGIVGYLGINDDTLIKKMNSSIEHRGPDGEGYFSDENANLHLGHRRLAILDLTDNGLQPMIDEENIIVYNGEVYNYKEIKDQLTGEGYTFKSNTDTEVILKAYKHWGNECLSKFNGMYSFAIWNKINKELFCARDRLGIKPFYYYFDKDRNIFIFASEIKAILQYEGYTPRPNDNIIFDYLYYGLVDHSTDTFFNGIKRLEAGTYLKIKEGFNIDKVKYWDVESFIEDKSLNKEKSLKLFKEQLIDSIGLQLRSDVKVGTSLSGGLDSTSIAAIIREKFKDSKEMQETFSYVSDYKQFDESYYIDLLAEKNDIRKNFVKKSSHDFIGDLKRMVYHQEEPFISTGMYAGYSVMERAKMLGVSVLLNGQGADEILGGYRKYRVFYLKEQIRSLKLYSALKSIIFGIKQTGKSYNIKDDLIKLKNIFYKKKTSSIHKYISKSLIESFYSTGIVSRSFRECLINDIKYTSLPSLLRYEDKNSMAWSVEARVPFLDHNLVEFCMKLPISLKMNDVWSKYILRETMKDLLPKEVVYRRDKMGFVTEQEIWLNRNKEDIYNLFTDGNFKSGKYVDLDLLLNDLNEVISENSKVNIWRIINLELWMREFII